MSLKEMNKCFREIDQCFREINRSFREIRKIEKAIRRQRILNERKRRNKTLILVAEEMRQKGASKRSIQIAVEGANEYLKPARKKSQSEKPELTPTPDSDVEVPGILLSEVETQPVAWLWERRIPLGKITILDGDPGMGKSLIAAQLAACVSTGRPMPDGTPGKQGRVILIAPEDGAEDTLKPRLEAAGGDPSQVLLLNTVESLDVKRVEICERPFSLSHDLEVLEDAIKRMEAVLVILDPLMAVLGHNIDSSRDQSVREVFTPLAQLAERTGCAVLIIRHLARGSAENPLYRGAGSIGIIAAARIGLIVAPDPSDQNKRILATTKNNLSKQVSNLTYQVVENEHGVPYIQWLEENHHPVKALFTNANISYERRAILKALQDSSSPLYAPQVASSTGLDYKNVRKMLPRLLHAGEIASPARGQYTALEHASLTINPTKNGDVPTETYVPTMTYVPIVPTDETTPEENSAVPTETSVPTMTNVPIVSTDETTPEENSAVPMETSVSSMTNVPGDEITQQENSDVPTEICVPA